MSLDMRRFMCRGWGKAFWVFGIACLGGLAESRGEDAGFRASGWVALELPPDEYPKKEFRRWTFEIGVSSSGWYVRSITPSQVEAWECFDGTNYYRASRSLIRGGVPGGFVTSRSLFADSAEYEKIVLYAFGQATNLNVGRNGDFCAPFIASDSPANTVYDYVCERSPAAPRVPLRASFAVSEAKLAAAVARLAAEPATTKRWLDYLTNGYAAGLKAASYEVFAKTNTQGMELPLAFRFVHPYLTRNGPRERYFIGMVTNLDLTPPVSTIPPLQPGSDVQDYRLGATYLFKTPDGRWPAAEEAKERGVLLVTAPPVPPSDKRVGNFQLTARRVLRVAFVILCCVPICVFFLSRRQTRTSDQR